MKIIVSYTSCSITDWVCDYNKLFRLSHKHNMLCDAGMIYSTFCVILVIDDEQELLIVDMSLWSKKVILESKGYRILFLKYEKCNWSIMLLWKQCCTKYDVALCDVE